MRCAYLAAVHKLIVIAILVLAAGSRDQAPASSSEPTPTAIALPSGMSLVADSSEVCMVNDMFMGRPQIPVQVEGRTYFGCCPDCKNKLENQPATRTAKDPVTGEPVDKARAVIVHDSSGKVYYFASEDTLRRLRG
jgi:YHS domain-containing protein